MKRLVESRGGRGEAVSEARDVSRQAPARCGDSDVINRLWLKATIVVASSRTGRDCEVTSFPLLRRRMSAQMRSPASSRHFLLLTAPSFHFPSYQRAPKRSLYLHSTTPGFRQSRPDVMAANECAYGSGAASCLPKSTAKDVQRTVQSAEVPARSR